MIADMPPVGLNEIAAAHRLALFLDYDGTLADFAPTPDHVDPDPTLIALLTRLSQQPHIRLAVISGRRLAHVKRLLPVPQIVLAGTYGLELQLADGQRIDRVKLSAIRPALDRLKPQWAQLIAGRSGFQLEDKNWALALHARYAEDDEARQVLDQAHYLALGIVSLDQFRMLGGHKFCEVAPLMASKGIAVKHLLHHFAEADALPVYVGDDDKDEEAFATIKAQGGLAVLVAQQPRVTQAHYRLESPAQVRQWLAQVAEQLPVRE